MSPVPGLTEKIAASLVTSLLKASAGIIRKRLSQSEAKKALEAAVASALAEALEGQELRDQEEDWEHFGSLLEEFFTREEAAFELAQLLDPRPDQVPDLPTLGHEFQMAGYVPETMPGFDLDGFLRAFFSAFYAAAGTQEPLRAGIDLKLLGTQLQKLGVMVSELGRVADASESSAASLKRIEVLIEGFVAGKSEGEELRRTVEAARAEGFLAAYRTFEDIGSGLLKAGIDLGVDARGVLEIMPRGSEASRALPPARLEAVRLLAGELRSAVVDHSPNEVELNALEARYRQHIIRWFESLTFRGMMRTPKPIVLPLEEVYVELRAVAEVPEAADAFSVEERRLLLESDEKDETKRRELMSQLDAFRRERWSRTIPERKSMAEALHQRDRRAFVILGDPGSGKTTLLHFLALVYARGPETAAQRLGVDLTEADRLPIFVPLAAFDDMLRESQREGRSLTLREFLPRYYDRRRGLPGLEPLFRRAFNSGRALVLLDGLDEVLDVGTRTYVTQQAGALIGDLAGVRFAVSSRFVGYREAPLTLPTLSVLDFGTPEIETFVRRWAHAFEKWAANGLESPEMLRKAQKLEADLLEDVKSNESVRRLAANPLMLTMLALLRRQVGRLPHRRVQLYESYVGTLLENWVDARSEGARERSVEILDQHQAESILIPLAFWLQQEKPSGTAGRAEIRSKLVEVCLRERGIKPEQAERSAVREAEAQADRFLQEMRQMAGLIIERGHDAFGFLHLTFQEYFAGRALAQLKDEERWEAIRPNLHDPRWREPVLLCAGRLGVVENRRAQVTGLVRSILENEDPTEADLHRNLLCALSIACDDVNLEPALVAELIEKAISHISTPINAFARELLRLLGQLITNGMANFEACLAPVTGAKDINRERLAIMEWSRFVEVRDIEAWLRGQLDNDNDWRAKEALDALAFKVGEDRSLQQKAIACLDSPYSGESAARALSRIAESHSEIRRELLECVVSDRGQVRQNALIALSGLVRTDAEVHRVFLDKLYDPDVGVQANALRGFSDLVGEAEEVRAAIREIALDAKSSVRRSAIDALAGLVEEVSEVRRINLECLKDREKWDQLLAMKALSRSFATDREALLSVLKLLNNWVDWAEPLNVLKMRMSEIPEIQQVFLKQLGAQDSRVRQAACQGLAEEGLASPEILKGVLRSQASLGVLAISESSASFSGSRSRKGWVSFWRRLLKRAEPSIRRAALSALSGVVDMDKESRHEVLERLGDENFDVQMSALSALSGVVSTDEEIRHAVLDRLVAKDSNVREGALSALSGIVDTDEEVRHAVLDWLGTEDYRVQRSALSALSGGVSTDEEICSAVMDRLGDERWQVRASALSALSKAVGTAERVRCAVLDMLGDERWEVRQYALFALWGAAGEDDEIRCVVLERLKVERWEVRAFVLSTLSRAVGMDDEARSVVLEWLEDEQWEVRMSALFALSEVVGTYEEVRRMVLERLGDPSPVVRRVAVSALADFMESGSEVRWAMLERLEDQDFSVRLQTVEVIVRWPEEELFESLWPRLLDWLRVDCNAFFPGAEVQWVRSVQSQIAKRFGARLPTDVSLRDNLMKWLHDPRWSSRLGAMLALLAWPGGVPDDVMTGVLEALEDPRGLEAYSAQLTAAAYLINRNDTAAEAIDLCLEALDYGTQPWENLRGSRAVRQQAAFVLGKLEPVFYDARIYDKLLHVLHNDEDANVRDAAYSTLVRLARMRDQQAVA